MTIGHLEKLERIAKALISNQDISPFWDYESPAFHMEYEGEVVAKERPRGGHHYTPQKTKEYEAKLKKLAKARMAELGLSRFYRGLVVHLTITDLIPDDWEWWKKRLATSSMMFNMTGGDLDNKEKAVLDAFNKVVFDDDRQVVQVFKVRKFGNKTGFGINISQVGLTKNDLANIEKLIGNHHASASTTTRK